MQRVFALFFCLVVSVAVFAQETYTVTILDEQFALPQMGQYLTAEQALNIKTVLDRAAFLQEMYKTEIAALRSSYNELANAYRAITSASAELDRTGSLVMYRCSEHVIFGPRDMDAVCLKTGKHFNRIEDSEYWSKNKTSIEGRLGHGNKQVPVAPETRATPAAPARPQPAAAAADSAQPAAAAPARAPRPQPAAATADSDQPTAAPARAPRPARPAASADSEESEDEQLAAGDEDDDAQEEEEVSEPAPRRTPPPRPAPTAGAPAATGQTPATANPAPARPQPSANGVAPSTAPARRPRP